MLNNIKYSLAIPLKIVTTNITLFLKIFDKQIITTYITLLGYALEKQFKDTLTFQRYTYITTKHREKKKGI